MLGGNALQEVAQKLVDHHAKMTNIFKEMYGDVRSVPPPPHACFSPFGAPMISVHVFLCLALS